MKVLPPPFFIGAILVCTCVVSVNARQGNILREYERQFEGGADHRADELAYYSSQKNTAVVQLDGTQVDNFVKSIPRSYSVLVMYTALGSQYGCRPCRPALGEFESCAMALRRSKEENPEDFSEFDDLFFVLVDVDSPGARQLFMNMKFKTVPNLILYRPISPEDAKGERIKKPNGKTVRRKPALFDPHLDVYPLQVGVSAKSIHTFLYHRGMVPKNVILTVPVARHRPVELWILLCIIGALAFFRRKVLIRRLLSKWTWFLLCMIVFCGVHGNIVFSAIHGSQWFLRNPQNGKIILFSPVPRQPLALEGFVMLVPLFAFTISLVAAAEHVRAARERELRHLKGWTVVYLAIMTVSFIFYVRKFTRASGGHYPYVI